MLWLDSTYPPEKAGQPGSARGPCPADGGDPNGVVNQYPNACVLPILLYLLVNTFRVVADVKHPLAERSFGQTSGSAPLAAPTRSTKRMAVYSVCCRGRLLLSTASKKKSNTNSSNIKALSRRQTVASHHPEIMCILNRLKDGVSWRSSFLQIVHILFAAKFFLLSQNKRQVCFYQWFPRPLNVAKPLAMCMGKQARKARPRQSSHEHPILP